jgi:hypothetical protein
VQDAKVNFKDTSEILNSYIDEIDTSLNREKLKQLMNGIYIESINKDII